MSAKAFPPYRVVTAGDDYWIEDSTGSTVVETLKLGYHYEAVFEEENIMQILCDALNGMETSKDEKQ